MQVYSLVVVSVLLHSILYLSSSHSISHFLFEQLKYFVNEKMIQKVAYFKQSVSCILSTQMVDNGKVWCIEYCNKIDLQQIQIMFLIFFNSLFQFLPSIDVIYKFLFFHCPSKTTNGVYTD